MKALITGINGQDGAYLAKLLLEKGYEVHGGDRRRSSFREDSRLGFLGIKNEIRSIEFDLLDYPNINKVIYEEKYDEVYNLAAQSFVKTSFDTPMHTTDVDGLGVLRILEAIRHFSKSTKFYQASTSEMFGLVQEVPQSEKTPFYPRSPYGVAKLYGHWITKNYRESYKLHASSGILFNHESELRGLEFVTKKIVNSAVNIVRGNQKSLILGNLDSFRDWGHAEDYVYGMYLMVQSDKPDDYVLATGVTTSIRDFVTKTFKYLGIQVDWEGFGEFECGKNQANGEIIVSVSEEFYRPSEVELLVGDSSKARRELNWEPKVNLDELIKRMVNFEFKSNEY